MVPAKVDRIWLHATINHHLTGRINQMKVKTSFLAILSAIALSCLVALPALAEAAFLVG